MASGDFGVSDECGVLDEFGVRSSEFGVCVGFIAEIIGN
jgi:hypothetical protein